MVHAHIPPETLGKPFVECLKMKEPVSTSSLVKLSMRKGETLGFCKLTEGEFEAFKRCREAKF